MCLSLNSCGMNLLVRAVSDLGLVASADSARRSGGGRSDALLAIITIKQYQGTGRLQGCCLINIVIMSAEREIPLNYQLTVTNVLTIGSKSMADFFVSFATPSGRQWKSPVIHGRVTKDNTRYPWIFTVDHHQLTINFHEIDHKNGREMLVGSMPLLLMKREGEEEFLIFGCTQANRGRKVAEVEFTYVQCSGVKSLSSYKKSDVSNEQSKRLSLQYTIEVEAENYDAKKGLNIIPQQPSARESQLNSKLPVDPNESLLQQDFHPSKLETLKVETNRNKALSEDSNFQLNLIKEMEDPADKWYRNNFGREKPSNLENYEFDIDNSRMASIVYEKSYEYLNELSFPDPHMEIRNIIIHSDKKPRTIELFSIDMDGSQLIKDKIATMQSQGTKYEWSNAVRLPKEKKAYGIEITTEDKEKLQGLILKDAHHTKSSLEIYNRKGFKVGKVNYSLKEIKKIEIQTLDIMEMQPTPEESNELDKSFLKSALPKTESKSNSLLNSGIHFRAQEGRNKLIKEIYLNRQRETEEVPRQVSLPVPNRRMYEYARTQPEVQRSMTNHAYLGRDVAQSPLKKNLRRNQYVPIAQPPSAQSSQPKSAAKAVSPFLQDSLIKQSTPSQTPQSNSHETSQQANQFLPSDHSYEQEELTEARIAEEEPQGSQLSKKIEELKRIGTDLGKKAKAFPSKKFTKNAKYKTVIYQEEEGIEFQQKRSLENSDSGKQEQNHKKAYRQPINATPSFQSLLINNTFSKEEDSRASKVPTKTKPAQQRPAEEPYRAALPHENISEANPISDDSQEVPISRHKTADQNLLKEMIQQKEADILSKRQQSLRAQSIIPEQSQRQQKGNSYGVNTQRMSINNVMQTSFVPTTTPTQKRASPVLDELKSMDYQPSEGWQQKRSSKEEVASVRDSVIEQSHHTKYSSQTIQPATQLTAGKLNYQITSISVNHYESAFGNKFLKVYIPNKHYYETPLNTHSNTLLWKCNGFLFSNVHQSQDLYLQLYNSIGQEQKMLGRVILSSREFHPQAEQSIIRAYLVLQSKIIGEVVIGYHSFGKNKKRSNWQVQRDLGNQRQAVSESHYNQKQPTTPVKRKRKKRDRSLNDSLTKFLRKNRREKINRYIVNEYSRAHIESRINPLQPRKYTGKNITIGRDIRFPFGPEDQHKILTPGPGAYKQRSDFERYQLQK